MTEPIARGTSLSSSFNTSGNTSGNTSRNFSANALTAPITPSKRVPDIDYSKVDPEVLKAAEGMEAMFVDYLMKVMRQTVPKNDMDLESPATEIYRGMLDSELAQKASQGKGLGLKEPIIAYLQASRYTKK